MFKNWKLRKAISSAAFMVIGVALGTLIIISLFSVAKNMVNATGEKQTEATNALSSGIEELKK